MAFALRCDEGPIPSSRAFAALVAKSSHSGSRELLCSCLGCLTAFGFAATEYYVGEGFTLLAGAAYGSSVPRPSHQFLLSCELAGQL